MTEKHSYIYTADKLAQETVTTTTTAGGKTTTATETLYYAYDANGLPMSLEYTGSSGAKTTYYYATNIQGDVTAILNSSGSAVVEYTYDAWGNPLTTSGSLASTVGKTNSLRYRGYVYDAETEFYYVSSRYYNPKVGRWINSDDEGCLGAEGEFVSYNLFAYCLNNPVNRTDVNGNWSLPNWAKIAIGVTVIAAAVAVTVATGGAAAGTVAAAVHCVAVGAAQGAIVGAVSGTVSGAVGGAVAHRIQTGSWSGAGQAAFDGAATGFMTGAITGAIEGGLSSSYCFVAGTAVLAASGAVAIETIEAGDYVWAWDEETGDVALKQVVETYINETDELVHVHVNGEEIVATPSHPFYSPVKGWTDAVHLRAGDILVLVNGEYVVVEKVQHEILEGPIKVYNFQVEDYHTYYVAGSGILVHNSCGANHGNSLSTNKPAEGYILRDKTTHDILKYGETTRGYRRYTQAFLTKNNAYMDFVTSGTKAGMHQWQHDMILNYISVAGQRPPLNFNLF